jgi:hypothetical protein
MYKHDAIIRAWLDGKAVQYRAAAGHWVDLPPCATVEKFAHFYATDEYRLTPVTVRYRVWADKLGVPHIASTLKQSDTVEKLPTFGRYLTEWVETAM